MTNDNQQPTWLIWLLLVMGPAQVMLNKWDCRHTSPTTLGIDCILCNAQKGRRGFGDFMISTHSIYKVRKYYGNWKQSTCLILKAHTPRIREKRLRKHYKKHFAWPFGRLGEFQQTRDWEMHKDVQRCAWLHMQGVCDWYPHTANATARFAPATVSRYNKDSTVHCYCSCIPLHSRQKKSQAHFYVSCFLLSQETIGFAAHADRKREQIQYCTEFSGKRDNT